MHAHVPPLPLDYSGEQTDPTRQRPTDPSGDPLDGSGEDNHQPAAPQPPAHPAQPPPHHPRKTPAAEG